MIAVDVGGRLGNQMFIYAFALNAADRLRCGFIVDYDQADTGAFSVPRYFETRGFSLARNRFLLQAYRCVRRWIPRVEFDSTTQPAECLRRLRRFAHYRGWMQSEEFFAPVRDLVRREFVVRAPFRENFAARYARRLEMAPSVVVHCRRTDYQEFGNPQLGYDLRLPRAYYEACLARIARLDEYQVFFVGDDLSEAKACYGGRRNFYFEENEPILDFQLLQAGDVLIVSNSTFAWWAAYLNTTHRQVFAPRNWLGFKVGQEWPVGISLSAWNWIEVPADGGSQIPTRFPARGA